MVKKTTNATAPKTTKSNGTKGAKAGKTPAAKKTAPVVTERKPREINLGLRKPQLQILTALSKAKRPLTRSEVAEKAGVDPTSVGDYAGPRPADRTEAASARYPFPDLASSGYVKAVHERPNAESVKTRIVYTISDKGRKALAKAIEEAKAK